MRWCVLSLVLLMCSARSACQSALRPIGWDYDRAFRTCIDAEGNANATCLAELLHRNIADAAPAGNVLEVARDYEDAALACANLGRYHVGEAFAAAALRASVRGSHTGGDTGDQESLHAREALIGLRALQSRSVFLEYAGAAVSTLLGQPGALLALPALWMLAAGFWLGRDGAAQARRASVLRLASLAAIPLSSFAIWEALPPALSCALYGNLGACLVLSRPRHIIDAAVTATVLAADGAAAFLIARRAWLRPPALFAPSAADARPLGIRAVRALALGICGAAVIQLVNEPALTGALVHVPQSLADFAFTGRPRVGSAEAVYFSVIIAPVVEELLFRYGVYGYARSVYGTAFAMPFSAAVFAGYHFWSGNPAWLLWMGVVTAALYEGTGGLAAPIIAHCLANALSAFH